jgi:DNA-binding transcriptional MerR regulator
MPKSSTKRLYSVGDVAKQLNIPRYSLQYLLEHGHIPEPVQRVAGRRVFTTEEIENARLILAKRRNHEKTRCVASCN